MVVVDQAVATRSRYERYLAPAAAIFFLLHAVTYLYFFVDDEGIPFVYARSLLEGRGFTYAAAEGHVEGYSDFLAVLVDTVILGILRLFGAGPAGAFVVGKIVSLAAGIAVVYLVTRHLARAYPRVGATVGAATLVLAGPLALWSCSSLETSQVALAFIVMIFALWSGRLALGAAAGIALVLLRIDGFVWVLAGTIAGLAAVSAQQRLRIITRVIPAIVVAAVLYHGWRYWYFGTLLSTPLEAKVLHKLLPHGLLAEKTPSSGYLAAFARLYGVVFLAAGAGGWIAFRRSLKAGGVLAALAVAWSFAALVGDWMFGFRFMVPALPLFALLVAETVSAMSSFSIVAGWAAAIGCGLWTAQTAVTFMHAYTQAERRPLFFRSPSLDPARFFYPYWSLYAALKDRVPPGTLIAYNQSGFLPFMLNVENIDDLGICSRFFAELPTRDVFFTEVGRYAPLTNKDVRTAGLSYLLYRQPTYLIERTDLLRKANAEEIPEELFAGRYRRILIDASEANAVYGPSGGDLEAFRREPRRFLENVAHMAHLDRVLENGVVIHPAEYARRFPFLREGARRFSVTGTHSLILRFDTADVPVYELHIEHLESSMPIEVTLTLWSAAGVRARTDHASVLPRRDTGVHAVFDEPVRAAQLMLEIVPAGSELARVFIEDLRVQGQTPALSAYLRQRIAFAQ